MKSNQKHQTIGVDFPNSAHTKLPIGWKRKTLGSIANVSWGDTKTTKSSYVNLGFDAYSAKGQDGYLPWADYEKTGVVLSAIGAVCGKTWLAKGKWSCIKNTIRFWATDPGINTEFLYWATCHPSLWPKRGSVQPFISQGDARVLEIDIPPLSEQHAIAHILGTFDDKIELNRRINETLEKMARALFKSWFVDFDPVRAKMGGRDPALPKHIADLFPDRLVESELGEIPEGWQVKLFGDIINRLGGNINPFTYPDTVFSHFSIPAYDEGQFPKQELGTEIKSTKTRVPSGAILLSKLNPEIERVWLVDVMDDEAAICSTEFLVLQGRTPIQRSYIYCLACNSFFREQIKSLVTGTSKSHQRAPASAIIKLEVVFPPGSIAQMFESRASELFNRVLYCRREIKTLSALRDALLPRLISGEIRLREAEKVMQNVM